MIATCCCEHLHRHGGVHTAARDSADVSIAGSDR
jgi:hypothetical protein